MSPHGGIGGARICPDIKMNGALPVSLPDFISLRVTARIAV
jgi:hypothetical protein